MDIYKTFMFFSRQSPMTLFKQVIKGDIYKWGYLTEAKKQDVSITSWNSNFQ